MGGHIFNLAPTPFLLSLFFVFVSLSVPILAQDDVCKNVNCVSGTCVPNKNSVIGFDCVCFSGWGKIPIGPFTYPACVIPNCTIDFQCGNSAPPPPPPPASPPPPFNLFDPCNLVWCGEGICVANGTGHYCQCNQGSANLLNQNALPCFKQCAFGADCSKLGFGPPAPPPPPPNGSGRISKSWRSIDGSNMIFLFAIILALVL